MSGGLASVSTWALSRFGGVPTRVVVPPRMEPKASGIISRDGATPA